MKMRTTTQNLGDTAKAVGKFIALQAYLKKQKSQSNFNLKELEKDDQTNPKVRRRKEIIEIRAEINEIDSNEIKKNTKDQ